MLNRYDFIDNEQNRTYSINAKNINMAKATFKQWYREANGFDNFKKFMVFDGEKVENSALATSPGIISVYKHIR